MGDVATNNSSLNFDWSVSIGDLSTVLLFLAGLLWTLRQDRKKRRNQYVAETLISAYVAFENFGGRNWDGYHNKLVLRDELSRDFEKSIATIQLLGPAKLANLVSELVPSDGKETQIGGPAWENLLTDVRNELRRNLGLDSVDSNPKSLRIYHRDNPK